MARVIVRDIAGRHVWDNSLHLRERKLPQDAAGVSTPPSGGADVAASPALGGATTAAQPTPLDLASPEAPPSAPETPSTPLAPYVIFVDLSIVASVPLVCLN